MGLYDQFTGSGSSGGGSNGPTFTSEIFNGTTSIVTKDDTITQTYKNKINDILSNIFYDLNTSGSFLMGYNASGSIFTRNSLYLHYQFGTLYKQLWKINFDDNYNPISITSLPDFPTFALESQQVVIDNKIYWIGGHNPQTPFTYNDFIQVFNLDTQLWENNIPMNFKRSASTVINIGNKIYIAGGSDNSVTSTTMATSKTFEVYDLDTNTWTRLADMPAARTLGLAQTYNNKIYVLGGYSTNGSVTYEYDLDTNTWASKLGYTNSSKQLRHSVLIDSKIYLLGNPNTSTGVGYDVYDIITNTFTLNVGSTWIPQESLRLLGVNGNIVSLWDEKGMVINLDVINQDYTSNNYRLPNVGYNNIITNVFEQIFKNNDKIYYMPLPSGNGNGFGNKHINEYDINTKTVTSYEIPRNILDKTNGIGVYTLFRLDNKIYLFTNNKVTNSLQAVSSSYFSLQFDVDTKQFTLISHAAGTPVVYAERRNNKVYAFEATVLRIYNELDNTTTVKSMTDTTNMRTFFSDTDKIVILGDNSTTKIITNFDFTTDNFTPIQFDVADVNLATSGILDNGKVYLFNQTTFKDKTAIKNGFARMDVLDLNQGISSIINKQTIMPGGSSPTTDGLLYYKFNNKYYAVVLNVNDIYEIDPKQLVLHSATEAKSFKLVSGEVYVEDSNGNIINNYVAPADIFVVPGYKIKSATNKKVVILG